MNQEKLVFLGISEAERLSASFERPFSVLYKRDGFTPDLVDMFATEFMVARTFSWHLGDKRGKGGSKNATTFRKRCKMCKRQQFSEFWNAIECPDTPRLRDCFDGLIDQVDEHPLAGKMWGAKPFPSALSKFYMVISEWKFPPFDNHAAKSLGAKGKTKTQQAQAFYSAFNDNDWTALSGGIASILQKYDINLPAARVFDKYLVLNGSGFANIPFAYAATKPEQTKRKWTAAASEIAELLGKSKLIQKVLE